MSIDTRGGVLVANNYINAVVNSNNWQAYGPAYQALGIFNHSSLSNVSCSIINNTIINNSNYVNGYSAGLVIRYYSNTAILNNVISGSCPDNTFYAYGLWTATSSTGSPFVSHNIIKSSNSNYVTNVPLNNELNYQQTGPGTLDAFGRAAAGNTFCINKGLYTGQYYDIDLTRNDIGTYGGPFSIDNYITNTGGKGRVFFIDVPHQISNINQLINIKAGAASKF